MTQPRRLELPEILQFHEVKDAFTRTVMVLMALTTLAGGVVEFLHSRAAVEGEHAGIQAHEMGIQAMAEFVRSDQAAQTEYETFALATEERTRRSNALQKKYLPLNNALPADRLQADELVARLGALVTRTEQLSELTRDSASPYAPSRDPAFPDRFFASKRGDYWALWARQDAANEEFTAWKKQQSEYTTVLTLYAAALYLSGLALALDLPVRRSLVCVAVLLLLAGSAGAVWTFASRPARMSAHEADRYAAAYAAGQAAAAAAHDPGGYEEARRHFSEALALRKRFAQAFADRADAVFNAGSPQPMGLPGVTGPEALKAAIDDQAAALTYGLGTYDLLLSYGNNLFLLGVEGDRAKSKENLRAGIAQTQRAIALDPGYPLQYYNLAETYLAAGEYGRARATYEQAVRLTLARDGQGDRFSRWRQQQFVSGALTDLETISRNAGRLAAPGKAAKTLQCEIAAMKAFVVGSVSMRALQPVPAVGECPPATPQHRVAVGAWSMTLWWQANLGSFARGRDVLSAQWYYEDPVQKKWVALPDVSVLGTSAPTPREDDPRVFERQSVYLTATTPPSCVPHGQFRAEVYLNGRPAGVSAPVATPAGFAAMTAVMRRDLNAAFCVPRTWTARRAGSGFIAEYRDQSDPLRPRGRMLVRYHYPRPWAATPQAKAEVAARYTRLTLERLLHLPPGGYEPVRVPDGYTYLTYMTERAYRARDTEVVVESGVHDDGAIIVSLVYGPTAYIENDPQARETFTTATFGRNGPDF